MSTATNETRRKEARMRVNDLDPSAEKRAIRHFILSSVALSQLDDDADLFEAGIVNSLFAVQLLTFVEKTFAIEVGMDDLDIDNFKSVNATAAFVQRRVGRAAA
jgi:acyl carrier protein